MSSIVSLVLQSLSNVWLWVLLSPVLLFLYIRDNDAKLKRLPPEVTAFSPKRWTEDEIRECYAQMVDGPKSLLEGKLPPKTGRRYIVTGGAGFLGGWIVLHLLQRGEDPRHIRVLDVRLPERADLQKDKVGDVDFIQVDITDREKTEEAFRKSWPKTKAAGSQTEPELTVFHTAATIRFYERHPELLHLSEKVNVQGTQNVLDAARAVGARTLVYTSSGSVSVRRSRFWLLPWEKEPKYFTQVITDDGALPKRHEQFFSNYAVSKLTAEGRVRAADRSPSGRDVLRTGCIRPGNGIYGTGGDLLVGMYLVRKVNATWIGSIAQSFSFVENCSLAHLLYEQRLIDIEQGGSNPDIGGQAFCIADAGAPPTYGEVYGAVEVLTKREVTFAHLSPSLMLGIAHIVEFYYLTSRFLSQSTFAFLTRVMPALTGDIIFLQPSMFALTNVHLYFDDSRARASPEKGGLGYANHCTTLEGVCQVVADYYRNGGKGTNRTIAGHQEADHASLVGAEQAVGEVIEKISDGLDVKTVLN